MKVLIISLDNLGDLVFCSALVDPLVQKYPDLKLSLLCKDYAYAVAQLFPHVSQIFAADPPWDRAPGRARGSWLRFFKVVKLLRSQEFDLVIVTSLYWKAQLVVPWIRTRQSLGFESRVSHLCLKQSVKAHKELKGKGRLRALLEPLHIKVGQVFTRLAVSFPTEPGCVVIHPFAGNPKRCLDFALWVQIAQKLTDLQAKVYWACAQQEGEELGCRLKSYRLPVNILIDFKELSRAAVFLGHDSGPLHIAHAMGVPVFGLYFDGVRQHEVLPQARAPYYVHRSAHQKDETVIEKAVEFAQQYLSL